MSHLESGSVVWVRLGQTWWPGSITTIAKCPPEFVQALRKPPIAIVKFFHENEFQDVHKSEHICSYNCERKEEFIRKGQSVHKNQSHGDVDLLAKFESDVVTAEKLTGGDMNILQTMGEADQREQCRPHVPSPPSSPSLQPLMAHFDPTRLQGKLMPEVGEPEGVDTSQVRSPTTILIPWTSNDNGSCGPRSTASAHPPSSPVTFSPSKESCRVNSSQADVDVSCDLRENSEQVSIVFDPGVVNREAEKSSEANIITDPGVKTSKKNDGIFSRYTGYEEAGGNNTIEEFVVSTEKMSASESIEKEMDVTSSSEEKTSSGTSGDEVLGVGDQPDEPTKPQDLTVAQTRTVFVVNVPQAVDVNSDDKTKGGQGAEASPSPPQVSHLDRRKNPDCACRPDGTNSVVAGEGDKSAGVQSTKFEWETQSSHISEEAANSRLGNDWTAKSGDNPNSTKLHHTASICLEECESSDYEVLIGSSGVAGDIARVCSDVVFSPGKRDVGIIRETDWMETEMNEKGESEATMREAGERLSPLRETSMRESEVGESTCKHADVGQVGHDPQRDERDLHKRFGDGNIKVSYSASNDFLRITPEEKVRSNGGQMSKLSESECHVALENVMTGDGTCSSHSDVEHSRTTVSKKSFRKESIVFEEENIVFKEETNVDCDESSKGEDLNSTNLPAVEKVTCFGKNQQSSTQAPVDLLSWSGNILTPTNVKPAFSQAQPGVSFSLTSKCVSQNVMPADIQVQHVDLTQANKYVAQNIGSNASDVQAQNPAVSQTHHNVIQNHSMISEQGCVVKLDKSNEAAAASCINTFPPKETRDQLLKAGELKNGNGNSSGTCKLNEGTKTKTSSFQWQRMLFGKGKPPPALVRFSLGETGESQEKLQEVCQVSNRPPKLMNDSDTVTVGMKVMQGDDMKADDTAMKQTVESKKDEDIDSQISQVDIHLKIKQSNKKVHNEQQIMQCTGSHNTQVDITSVKVLLSDVKAEDESVQRQNVKRKNEGNQTAERMISDYVESLRTQTEVLKKDCGMEDIKAGDVCQTSITSKEEERVPKCDDEKEILTPTAMSFPDNSKCSISIDTAMCGDTEMNLTPSRSHTTTFDCIKFVNDIASEAAAAAVPKGPLLMEEDCKEVEGGSGIVAATSIDKDSNWEEECQRDAEHYPEVENKGPQDSMEKDTSGNIQTFIEQDVDRRQRESLEKGVSRDKEASVEQEKERRVTPNVEEKHNKIERKEVEKEAVEGRRGNETKLLRKIEGTGESFRSSSLKANVENKLMKSEKTEVNSNVCSLDEDKRSKDEKEAVNQEEMGALRFMSGHSTHSREVNNGMDRHRIKEGTAMCLMAEMKHAEVETKVVSCDMIITSDKDEVATGETLKMKSEVKETGQIESEIRETSHRETEVRKISKKDVEVRETGKLEVEMRENKVRKTGMEISETSEREMEMREIASDIKLTCIAQIEPEQQTQSSKSSPFYPASHQDIPVKSDKDENMNAEAEDGWKGQTQGNYMNETKESWKDEMEEDWKSKTVKNDDDIKGEESCKGVTEESWKGKTEECQKDETEESRKGVVRGTTQHPKSSTNTHTWQQQHQGTNWEPPKESVKRKISELRCNMEEEENRRKITCMVSSQQFRNITPWDRPCKPEYALSRISKQMSSVEDLRKVACMETRQQIGDDAVGISNTQEKTGTAVGPFQDSQVQETVQTAVVHENVNNNNVNSQMQDDEKISLEEQCNFSPIKNTMKVFQSDKPRTYGKFREALPLSDTSESFGSYKTESVKAAIPSGSFDSHMTKTLINFETSQQEQGVSETTLPWSHTAEEGDEDSDTLPDLSFEGFNSERIQAAAQHLQILLNLSSPDRSCAQKRHRKKTTTSTVRQKLEQQASSSVDAPFKNPEERPKMRKIAVPSREKAKRKMSVVVGSLEDGSKNKDASGEAETSGSSDEDKTKEKIEQVEEEKAKPPQKNVNKGFISKRSNLPKKKPRKKPKKTDTYKTSTNKRSTAVEKRKTRSSERVTADEGRTDDIPVEANPTSIETEARLGKKPKVKLVNQVSNNLSVVVKSEAETLSQSAKKPRKRKPTEVDNLLMWAVESGGSSSRSSRHRDLRLERIESRERGIRERDHLLGRGGGGGRGGMTMRGERGVVYSERILRQRSESSDTRRFEEDEEEEQEQEQDSRNESRFELAPMKKPRREPGTTTGRKRGRPRKVKPTSERRSTSSNEEEDSVEGREDDPGARKSERTHSSPQGDTEEDLPDLTKVPLVKVSVRSGDLVWWQDLPEAGGPGCWWPGYVEQVYPATRRAAVCPVGRQRNACPPRLDLNRIRVFEFGTIPDFVDCNMRGLTAAVQLLESFCQLRNHGTFITPQHFFSMPPEEQDAFIIVSFTPKDDPQDNTENLENEAKDSPRSSRQWYDDPIDRDEEGEEEGSDEEASLSARDQKKFNVALRVRRRENERLLKFMQSPQCMQHLWRIFYGEEPCERHSLYQNEVSRRSLLWTGMGPFQLDQSDDQILSVVDFLCTELMNKEPGYNLMRDYVFRVWMPEAIKEALRVVRKVPEEELETALDEGYRETRIERKARRLEYT